jgi:acyl-CoA synthetase (AMP-forming)/AMP-acid ligase II
MKLHEILERTAWKLGANTFLFDGDLSISYKEADRITGHIAGCLLSLGVQKGDRVAIFSPNSMNYVLAMFGIFKAGAIASLINILNADSLSYYVNDMKANVLFYSSDVVESVRNNRDKMPTVKHYICLDGKVDDSMGWDELTSSKPIEKNLEIDDQDPCHLSYTSGTSGRPKGCVLAHGPTARATNCIAERLSYRPQDTILCPTTLSSSFRLVASDLPGIHRGSSIGIMKTWNPYLALDIINQREVTVFVGNPIILKDLLDAAVNDGRLCSSLRMVLSGGGPVYKSLKESYQKYFKIPLVESYGQSELGGFVGLGYPKMVYNEKISAVGPSLPDKEVKIVDEDDKEVPIGEPGEIILKGGFMLGYWQRPEETAYSLRNGWLHTGDAGKMDDDGYIYMFGRISERIKSGELNIYARMLEESMSNHQSIRQVAVIGVPDKELGEIPKAYVSLYPEIRVTEDKLMDYFRKNLGKYSPKVIEIVDQMPMTPTGKISKRELEEREKISVIQ